MSATVLDTEVPARAPFSTVLRAGEELSIIDVGGNQAVGFLCYDAADTAKRYSSAATIAAQRNVFLTTGSVLRTAEGTPLLTVVADTCGRHDTIGGACSKESNGLRFGRHTHHQHACVENFLIEGSKWGLGRRDVDGAVNWYLNVPVEEDGTLGVVDGVSAPGLEVRLRAETDVLVLVSNCPQTNDPGTGFDPTPVRLVVTAPGRGE